jgi:hypothetical protein
VGLLVQSSARLLARRGGQPPHRVAWDDPDLDRLANTLYTAMPSTSEAAWVRPSGRWWPRFRRTRGEILRRGILDGQPSVRIADRLKAAWKAAQEPVTPGPDR